MGLSQRLQLRQTQSLIMTPQLQLAIKLLQLSNLELSEFVEAEIEKNPLLELGEPQRDEMPVSPDEAGAAAAAVPVTLPEQLADGVGEVVGDAAEHWEAASGENGDGTHDRGGDGDLWRARDGARRGDDNEPAVERAAGGPRSLREHLSEQIGADLRDPIDRVVAAHLLEHLDEAGYLRTDLDTVARELGCAVAHVERVLARVQEFDPPGVFARNLAECLALQLRDRNRLDPAMQLLLEHLPLLAARNAAALMQVCQVDAEDLAEMVAEIKALDPRPGYSFDAALPQLVVPDILMVPQPQGGWIVELNPETMPRVLVNSRYYARVSRGARSPAEREYLSERFQAANWLVKSLHQRALTIVKVAAEVVRRQDAFFSQGVQALRPLILREVADAIGMHESTVSRVTSNKYIATPRGVFELKFFFTSAIPASGGGEAHSAEAVRFRIRGLIDGEPSNDALSDEKIVELLQREGVEIARRTVAKYREAMRIPSSVQRRRDKQMAL
ncbi:MAG TPA: RNA polymerase factor sigma-54 [Stellaceae bacterium]|nr:RNA polymerase factor sigma-54 [Stellaceae bacterium]